MRFVLTPPSGYRTYRLMLFSLVVGLAIAVFGIYRNADPWGISAIIATVLIPITGGAAANNIGTRSKGVTSE